MRHPDSLRKRVASEPVVTTTGLAAILQGAFGTATPESVSSSQVGPLLTEDMGGIYHFHEGDLFTPGTGNWVKDPDHDTALMTLWGHGFLCRANAFRPEQPPQVYIPVTVPLAAQAGIVVGTWEQENLLDNPPDQTGG